MREFLCSEAMFYLGVPTTRAASLVVREFFDVDRRFGKIFFHAFCGRGNKELVTSHRTL